MGKFAIEIFLLDLKEEERTWLELVEFRKKSFVYLRCGLRKVQVVFRTYYYSIKEVASEVKEVVQKN
jgi:hypothetical protein